MSGSRKPREVKSYENAYGWRAEEHAREEALSRAVALHVGMASFSMGVPEAGAPDVVKTAENFYKFLTDDGYVTESRVATTTVTQSKGDFFTEAPSGDGDDEEPNVIQVTEK